MSFESFVFDLSFSSDDEDELYVAAAHVTTEGIDVEPFRRGFVEGHIGYWTVIEYWVTPGFVMIISQMTLCTVQIIFGIGLIKTQFA